MLLHKLAYFSLHIRVYNYYPMAQHRACCNNGETCCFIDGNSVQSLKERKLVILRQINHSSFLDNQLNGLVSIVEKL